MASLTSCMKKAGAALRDEDRAAILARFNALTEAGTKAAEAARQAVDEQVAAVRGLVVEAGGTVAEPEAPAPESKPAAPAQAAQEQAAPASIQDVGEKIGGARKDRWKERGLNVADLDSMSESEGATLATKANVWKPDYAAIAEQSDPVTAAMVKVVYDQLAAQPKTDTPQGRRDYVTAMQAVRKVYGAVKTVQEAKDAYATLREELGVRRRDGSGFVSTGDKDASRVMFSVYKGRSDPFVFGYNELSRAKKLVEQGFPGGVEPWTRRYVIRTMGGQGTTAQGVTLYQTRAEEVGTPLIREQIMAGVFEVRAKAGKTVAFAPTRADAEAAAKALYERTKGSGDDKVEPDRPHLDKVQRSGLPERIDREVTPEMLLQDFGFRGIEFGNWAAQDERRKVLALAYDALSDLAAILNVPPKAISLNGTMGLAFGARGGGKFAAHYEPGKLVINITKLRGAGSLAHEWGHAVDHYLGELDRTDAYQGKARGASGWYSQDRYTGEPQKRMSQVDGKWTPVEKMRLENLRPELAKSVDEVMKRLYETPIPQAEALDIARKSVADYQGMAAKETDPRIKTMYEDGVKKAQQIVADLEAGKPSDKTKRSSFAAEAQRLSGKAIDGYWIRPTEMFARAFESYVFDRLVAMGAKSEYLVHGVEQDRYSDGTRYKGNPYPTGEERQAINAAFDKLIGTLQTRTDDAGNVALFSLPFTPKFTVDDQAPSAQTSANGTPSADDRRAVELLQTRLNVERPDLVLDAVVAGSGAQGGQLSGRDDRARQAATDVAARLFGKRLTFYTSNVPFASGVFSHKDPSRIFLERGHRSPVMAVAGHEMLHALRFERPDLYETLRDRIRAVSADTDQASLLLRMKRRKMGLSPLSQDSLEEEFLADVVGDRWTEPEFWSLMSQGQPQGMRRVLAAIVQWLDGLIDKIRNTRPFNTAVYLTDIKAARQAVADAMRNYSAGEVGTVPDNGEVKFSRRYESTNLPLRAKNTKAERDAAWHAHARIVANDGVTSPDDLAALTRITGFSQWARSPIAGDVDATARLRADIAAGDWPGGVYNRPTVNNQGAISLSSAVLGQYTDEQLSALAALADRYDVPIVGRGFLGDNARTDFAFRKLQPHGFVPHTGIKEYATQVRDNGIQYIRPGGGIGQNTPLFSQGQGAKPGITMRDAEAVAATVRAMFPKAPPIFLHEDTSQVRADVRRMIKDAGAENDAEALYHRGEIHVFINNLKDVERALFVIGRHEIRHAGLAAMFATPQQKNQALLGIALKNRSLMDEAKALVASGRQTSRATAIEEVLADMPVSRLMALDGIDRLIARIRQWLRDAAAALRKKGYARLADAVDPSEWTDNDVAAFVLRAENISRAGDGMQPASGGTMFSEQQNTGPWYSALARAVKGAAMNAAPASAWKAAIKNWTTTGKAKADEVTWSGLDEWLDMQQGKVTKQAVQQFLDANGVRVQETVLEDTPKSTGEEAYRDELERMSDEAYADAVMETLGIEVSGDDLENRDDVIDEMVREQAQSFDSRDGGGQETKYSNYTLPGGTNYREVLLTLPEKTGANRAPYDAFNAQMKAKYGDRVNMLMTPAEEAEARRLRDVADGRKQGGYKSSHWDQPNILAHIRVNDRTDADGKRVLFVEEIQSDWGQAGKKQGFGQTMRWTVMDKRGPGNGYQRGDFATEAEALAYIDNNRLGLTRSNAAPREVAVAGVPAAPFVGKTDAWVSLAIKRIVKMAVDGGYDRVAFVTGEQSAERYDLSKQISKVTWFPEGRGGKLLANGTNGGNVMSQDLDDAAKLEDYIGKDVTKRLLESKPKYDAATGEKWHELSGLDLKVGGEGMKAFYDKIVPAVAKDVLRKVGGGQMQTVELQIPGQREGDRDSTGATIGPNGTAGQNLDAPGFDITDAMKAHAAGGMPMFSRAQQDKQERTAEKATAAEKDNLAKALTGLKGVRAVRVPAGYVVNDLIGKSAGTMHWWHKSVGTPYNVALRNPQFKPVFDAIQNFLGDVSHYAAESANKAPTILPKLETLGDVLPEVHVFGKTIGKSAVNPVDAKAAAAPIFEGTLDWGRDEDGKAVRIEELERRAEAMSAEDKAQLMLSRRTLDPRVLKMWRGLPLEQFEAIVHGRYRNEHLKPGVVWSTAELRSQFNLTPQQIALYREFRAATDQALEDLATSSMIRMAGKEGEDLREQALSMNMNDAAELLRDRMFDLAEQIPDEADKYNKAGNAIIDIADRVQDLQDRGYAPLSRFGGLTLDVVSPEGERLYFGMFETDRERRRKARELEAQYPDAIQTQGAVSKREWELFAGVTPETLELFADKLGISEDLQKTDLYQNWLRFAKADRSGLKRLIHRKGVPGFSQDIGRVLASFVYSTARQTSLNLHAGTAEQAIENIDRTQGQLKDYAVALNQYVKNPQEEAQALRGILFAQYLGGSLASALVNATQPFLVTFPYLAQYGGVIKAEKQMAMAVKDVARNFFPKDPGLTKALREAIEDGVVAPQEVFFLQAQASGKGQLRTSDGTAMGWVGTKTSNGFSRLSNAWGRPFAIAELFNRRLTFIAAYRTAVEQGMPDPAKFARDAVVETQFSYNKGNRPPWARGGVGSTLFTFKTYAISMVEHMTRNMRTPAGRKAALVMLVMLVLVAGIDGLPFMEDIEDVIDGFAQRVLDKNFSLKSERNAAIARAFMSAFGDKAGAHMGEFLARGISGIPGAPIDVSGRLGLHNLIPGTGLFLKKDNYSRDVGEIAGAGGSFVARSFEALGQALGGDPLKALVTASPTAVQNVAKAIEMKRSGYYPDTKQNMVVKTDGYDALSKGLGFQPNIVKRTQDVSYERNKLAALAKLTEREIVDAIAAGIVKNDEAAQRAGWDRVQQWNYKNPETPIKVSPDQVVRRARNMTTEKTQRMLKSAPKELRPGMAEAFRKAKETDEVTP